MTSLFSRIASPSSSNTTATAIRFLSSARPSSSRLSSSSPSSSTSPLSSFSSSLLSSPSASSSSSSSSSSSPLFFSLVSSRSFATLREYNQYRAAHPTLPPIPKTDIPPIETQSNISEEDREKERKIYSTYGKGKAAARKAEKIYNRARDKARKLGLKTPETLMDEVKMAEKKKKSQEKRRLGRSPPYGTQAKIVYDYIVKNQPVFRRHLQEVFVGKPFSMEGPRINQLLTDLNTVRRCSLAELTMKNNTVFNRVLKLLLKQKLIYGKPSSSPMVKALFDQYAKQNTPPPVLKSDEIKQYFIVLRDYPAEQQKEAEYRQKAIEKEKAEKQALVEAEKKRAELNKPKRQAEIELRRAHNAAERVRNKEKAVLRKEQREEIAGLPKRRPGEARLPLDEVKKRYTAMMDERKKQEDAQKEAEMKAKEAAATAAAGGL